MALQRFFLPPEQLKTEHVTISGEIAHQLQRVLRLTKGAHVLLLDGIGQQYEAELLGYGNGKAELRVVSAQPASGEPSIQIHLYQALLKGEKFDYVLQKGTELGISLFVPVLMERCVSDSVSQNKLERWRKIIREAAEQARRGRLPQLADATLALPQTLKAMPATDLKLLAWEEETTHNLQQVLAANAKPRTVAILIGPEGGITSKEAELAHAAGFNSVSLGKRILRAETAGPIAAVLTLFQYGDML